MSNLAIFQFNLIRFDWFISPITKWSIYYISYGLLFHLDFIYIWLHEKITNKKANSLDFVANKYYKSHHWRKISNNYMCNILDIHRYYIFYTATHRHTQMKYFLFINFSLRYICVFVQPSIQFCSSIYICRVCEMPLRIGRPLNSMNFLWSRIELNE